MSGRFLIRRYGLLFAALFVFTASVFLSFQRIKETHETTLHTANVNSWLVTQASFELQRLLGALDRYVLDPSEGVSQASLVERFDIFWSRLPMLVEGHDSVAITEVTDAKALVARAVETLHALVPRVETLDRGDSADYREMRDSLAAFVQPLNQLALDVNRGLGLEQRALREQLRRLYLNHIAYFLLILASAGVLVFMLVREAQSARRNLVVAEAAEEQIRHAALRDSLTGIPNRVLFRDRVGQAIGSARRQGQRVAVHYLDLDHFKDVNDSLGHPAGDRVLVEIAGRLAGCLRESDTVARLGGDEFAIVQTGVTSDDSAAILAQRLADSIAEPVLVDEHTFHLSVSVGVTLYPDDGGDIDELLQNADTALYRAKSDGRGTFRFFVPEMNRQLRERRALERDLRRAMRADALELHYQPRFSIRDRRLVGMEALIRWTHPTRGRIAPATFIPVAESSGLIVAIGRWVLTTACAQNVRWQEDGLMPLRVAVNLSAAQFEADDLVATVREVLAETGLDPVWLELEITESVLLRNAERTVATLEALRDLGIHLSLDDFGTGYSSLSYLQLFRFNSLKIDRSFARGLGTGADGEAIFRAIHSLARSLSMSTIAEGVESREQLLRLRAMGCDEAQGYHLAPPEAPEAFGQRLADLRAVPAVVD